MDEHYYGVAIKVLAQKVDTLEYMNQELEKENRNLREQLKSAMLDALLGKEEA